MKKIKKFLHDKLHWGYPTYPIEVENMYENPYPQYKCKYCDDVVLKDSQGNWFHSLKD